MCGGRVFLPPIFFSLENTMKQGANLIDQRNIAKMFEDGKKAEDISKALRIDQKVVENFKPKAKAETKPETK
jgi:hypothetical protein